LAKAGKLIAKRSFCGAYTELPNSVSQPDVAERIQAFYKEIAIPAESFARAVAFAMSQPEDVDVNEILSQISVTDVVQKKEKQCKSANLEKAIWKSRPSGSAAWE
jgi:hypothetical protein